LIKRNIPTVTLEGYEPDPSIKAEPIKNGRGGPRPQKKTNHRKPNGRKPNASNQQQRPKSKAKPSKQNRQRNTANRPENFGNR
jgi:ATP-dependent RNA helicase RhlE